MEEAGYPNVNTMLCSGFFSPFTTPPPLSPTLFPYTTLFRSCCARSSELGPRLGAQAADVVSGIPRSEEHTSELQSLRHLVCRLLLEKKNDAAAVPHLDRRRTADHPAGQGRQGPRAPRHRGAA